MDETDHRDDNEDDSKDLSEEGRKLMENNYETEEETFSSATRPVTSTKTGWGFMASQVWL